MILKKKCDFCRTKSSNKSYTDLGVGAPVGTQSPFVPPRVGVQPP